MNILDYISEGEYPEDDRGRPLVPMKDGRTAVIAATDRPDKHCPIIGWAKPNGELQSWQADGTCMYTDTDMHQGSLLPPALYVVLFLGADGDWHVEHSTRKGVTQYEAGAVRLSSSHTQSIAVKIK